MINTKILRNEYRIIRNQQKKNASIGLVIITILGTIGFALTIRFACLAIVAVHNIIK